MKKIRLVVIISLSCILAACNTTRNAAPVVDRTPAVKTSETGKSGPITATPGVTAKQPDSYYTVKKGDTLLRIALDHGQNYRDLVAWNNLANPNDIKVDQVLRVAQPEGGTTGAQTASVVAPSTHETKTPTTSSASSSGGGQAAINKNSPRGDKKPYSTIPLIIDQPENILK